MSSLANVTQPYAFHQVMRSLFIPLRLATNARDLALETNLDPNIDRVSRRSSGMFSLVNDKLAKVARVSAYEAMGGGPTEIEKHLKAHPTGNGMVVGDETRLRQIITNLARWVLMFILSLILLSKIMAGKVMHASLLRPAAKSPSPRG